MANACGRFAELCEDGLRIGMLLECILKLLRRDGIAVGCFENDRLGLIDAEQLFEAFAPLSCGADDRLLAGCKRVDDG